MKTRTRTTIGWLERTLGRVPPGPMLNLARETVTRVTSWSLAVVFENRNSGLEQRLRGLLSAGRHRSRGLRLGRGIILESEDRISLGSGVAIADGVLLSATGEQGRIRIGDHTHIDRYSVLYGQGGLDIGVGCAIAAGVLIYSQTNRFDLEPTGPILSQGTKYAPVTIGDDVWLGAGAVVLPGVSIGDHAVVAAGAVLHQAVAEWQVVAGVPAKPVRDRREKR